MKRLPTIRQIDWVSVILQIVPFGLIAMPFYSANLPSWWLRSAAVYLLLTLVLHASIPRYHRKGIAFINQGNYVEAIDWFEQSYAFFQKNIWIDRYRYLVLLSISAISYREMALCNIAFLWGQLGDGVQSMHYYQQALIEFPNSVIANSGLRLLKSMENLDDKNEVP